MSGGNGLSVFFRIFIFNVNRIAVNTSCVRTGNNLHSFTHFLNFLIIGCNFRLDFIQIFISVQIITGIFHCHRFFIIQYSVIFHMTDLKARLCIKIRMINV